MADHSQMLPSLFQRLKVRDSYDYEPLASKDSIRLIHLLPGEWNSDIECKLEQASLDASPEYEALSYVWGDVKLFRKILLDGQSCRITHNLEVALRHLRDENDPRILWVDALCINQLDIEERNSQVRIMGQIYKSAKRVLAWLGEAEEGSDAAVDLAEELGMIARSIPMSALPLTPRKLLDAGFDASTKDWATFWRLMARPYWKRMWIIQEQHFAGDLYPSGSEVLVADRCFVGVGRKWLPRTLLYQGWMLLMMVARNRHAFLSDSEAIQNGAPQRHEPFQSFSLHAPSPVTGFFITLSIAHANYLGPEGKQRLSSFIRITRGFQATDPRDKIFALHGILGAQSSLLRVDYNSSLDTVLRQTVEFAMEEYGNLSILEGNRVILPTDMPSWYPIADNLAVTGGAWDNKRGYNASKGRAAEKPKFLKDGKVMVLSGVVVGTAKEVIGPYKDMRTLTTVERQQEWQAYWPKIRAYWDKLTPERQETMWRTYVMDQEHDGAGLIAAPAPDQFGLAFRIAQMGEPIPLPEDFMPGVPEEARKYAFVGQFLACFDLCNLNYCFFDTDKGQMGIGPYHMKPNDVVTVLLGGAFCLVLRPKGNSYQLIGEAYVHGVMEGELMREDDQGNIIGLREYALC